MLIEAVEPCAETRCQQCPRDRVSRAADAHRNLACSPPLPWFERGCKSAPNDVPLLEEYALTLGEAGRYRDMLAAGAQDHVALDSRQCKSVLHAGGARGSRW